MMQVRYALLTQVKPLPWQAGWHAVVIMVELPLLIFATQQALSK
jgi:hypothetical protein